MAYDLGVLGALAFFTWRGSSKGFVWQLATIGALVLAFCFAGPASAILAPRLGLRAPLDRWVSMLILYAVCSFACFVVARGLRKGIEKIEFQGFDSHLGAVLGLVKGAVLCLLVTFFAVVLVPESHPHVLGSHSGYASAIVFDELRPVVPEDYHGYLDESLKKLGQGGLEPTTDESRIGDGSDQPGSDPSGDPQPTDGGSEIDPDDPRNIVDQLLLGLPDTQSAALRQGIEQALANVDETIREERVTALRDATPETLSALVASWRTGLTPAERERRKALLFGIVGVYTPYPAAQQAIADEVAGQLAGVPSRVQLNVLEDWHADLLDRSVDPDPVTSPLTSLDQRIGRQLAAANVPLESLDQALQDRLQTWR